MSSLNLFGKEWLNIVFENRNKLYGAYKLRQESTKTTFTALAIGIGLLGTIFGSSYLYASKSDPTIIIVDLNKDPLVDPTVIIDPKINEVEPIIEKGDEKNVTDNSEKATVKDVMKNIKFVEMTATKDNNVTDENLAAQNQFNDNIQSGQDNLEANTDGVLNKDGIKSGKTNTESTTKPGDGTRGRTGLNENTIVKLVQKKAAPTEGFEKFFESYIRKFSAKDLGGSEKEILIKLRFVVEKDGSFTDIKVVDDKHGLGNEAIRVLKAMPNWKPAQHNGRTVRSQFTLPIKVRINN